MINMESDKQTKNNTMLDKVDLKVINVLQKERKDLTLQEIANKTGEKPQKIAISLWKIFFHNQKLLNENLLQVYL